VRSVVACLCCRYGRQAGLGGFMKVNLNKEMACGEIFHAGYFIRYVAVLLNR